MKARIILASLAFALVTLAQAQYREQSSDLPSSFTDRVYFGGGGGFSAGSSYVNVSFAPMVGYRITDRWAAGVRITYQYLKYYDVRYNNYGGGPFAQYSFTENFFGYTEYEYLKLTSPDLEASLDYDSWFLGIGYTEYFNDHAGFQVMALYNLLYSDGSDTPYASPLTFRIGFIAGF